VTPVTGRARAAALAVVVVGLTWAATARAQINEGLGVPRAPQPPSGQIEAGKLSKVPKQTKFVEAEYPKEAAAKGIEAEVLLLLDINVEGKIDAVGIAQPADPPGMGFDEAALAAAQQFEFEPAEMGGKPIAVQLQYKYKFKLKPRAEVPATPPPAAGVPAPGVTARPPAKPVHEPRANFIGILRERGTRLPLPGVVVTVFRDDGDKPVGFEAPADAEGKFRFYDLAPGDWKILVEPPGFFPFRTTETIAANEAIDVTYYVERGSYNPFDVTVTATRPRKEVSRTVIAAKEIDKIPGTSGDPLAVVQNFAGVARVPFNGIIIVRGAAPEDTQIFVDGATVPLIYHFGGLRSVIPIGILDSIEFYPGNFSPAYGRAIGGVIDVQIKKLQPKKVGGYVDLNLFDGGFFLESPLGDKGGIAIAARRSWIDAIILATVPDNAGVNFLTAPRYYDYQLVANYRPTPAHDLRLLVFGSDDRLALLFSNPADFAPESGANTFSASTTFVRTLATYKYIPNPELENTLKVSQGFDWQDFNAGNLFFRLKINAAQLRDTFRYKFGERLTLVAGTDLLLSSSDVNVSLPAPPKEGEPPGPFDATKLLTTNLTGQIYFSPALFTEVEWKPIPKLLLLPGVRFDHFSRISQSLIQPRFTGRLQLGERVTVKGGAGLFVQEPFFDETNPSFGNPNLKAEKALHYSAGVEFKPRPHITLDATGFYKDLWSLVSQTTALGPDGKALRYDNGGRGRVYGLELVARHEFNNNFAGWVAYTLMKSQRQDSGSDRYRLFDFDQTHILTIVGTYLLRRNWQVGGRFRLVSGNPITPVTGSVYNASQDRYDPTYGAVNSSRNPLFHQLDIRVDKRWVYQSWMLNLYMELQNVYSQQNAEGLSYNYDYSKKQRQTGLPLLPVLGVRAEF
jgi:TonB family protein